jgi:hypothetical protein
MIEMASFPSGLTSLSEVKTLDRGPLFLYVLLLPEFEVEGTKYESQEVFAVPIFSRKDGLLFVLPHKALFPMPWCPPISFWLWTSFWGLALRVQWDWQQKAKTGKKFP